MSAEGGHGHGGGGLKVEAEVLEGIPKTTVDVFDALFLGGLLTILKSFGLKQEEGGHGGGHH